MIKAVIIDDEPNNQELISNLLKHYATHVQVLSAADSVKTGYQVIRDHKPNLVFLDIQMQDGTGFDLLRLFDKPDFKVLFVTAHEEFAIEAFKYSAIDYLLKPLSPASLLAALKKAEESLTQEELSLKLKTLLDNMTEPAKQRRKIILKTLERIYSVDIQDIIRFESDGGYTKVYLADGSRIMVSRILKEFDDVLSGNDFVRVHHSHLININQVYFFEKSESQLVMKDQSVVPVSGRKKDHVLDLLNMS